MYSILNKLGSYGPIILLLLTIVLLRDKMNLLFYYLLFYLIGIILNTVLKGFIQQPRPSIDNKTFNLMMKNKERYITKYGTPYDIFGMPSGHSQSVLFSTFFIYFALHNIKITFLFALISLNTLLQRVNENHHTILQVIIGSFVGILLSYIAYEMSKKNIVGKLTNKKDDYAPI
jgi:membrane-associated phospholipid phosphatase